MSADLVVKHTYHTAFSVLTRELDIHLTLASLGIMSHTSGRHLVLLEVDRDPLLDAKVLQIVLDVLMGLILVKLFALSVEIGAFRSVLLQERIKDLLGDPQILSVRLIELLQELHGKLRILILKLRVDLKLGLKEPLVALLQIFRQSMIQCLQFKTIFLGLL